MKMTTRTPEEIRHAAEKHSQFLNVVFGSMMDLADSLMRDAIEEMTRQGLYKREVKREANLALQAVRKLLDILRVNTCGHRMLYLDLLDAVQDGVAQDLTKLHFAVKQVLDRHKIEHSEMKARIETSHALLHLAARSFKAICKEGTSEYHIPFHRIFSALNPDGALQRWTSLHHMLCRYPEGTERRNLQQPGHRQRHENHTPETHRHGTHREALHHRPRPERGPHAGLPRPPSGIRVEGGKCGKLMWKVKNTKLMWIARNKNGTLRLFLRHKPNNTDPLTNSFWLHIEHEKGMGGDYESGTYIDRSLFPEVTFENSPVEVEIKILK